ncbi:MAG TPA: metalloregulator ArsR/SmtB family transcription factor, partial [Terracidiphilus sp.]
ANHIVDDDPKSTPYLSAHGPCPPLNAEAAGAHSAVNRTPEKRIKRCIAARRLKPLPVFFVYALTRICSVEYIKGVESVFEIIAEPNRRAILGLLVSSQKSVGEIERQLRMSQPAVSKHLRVLREAGFVESKVDAQRRLYRLKPEPLHEVDAWLAPFRRFWSAHVDALERRLDRMDQSAPSSPTPTKSKTSRRRGPNRESNKGETP